MDCVANEIACAPALLRTRRGIPAVMMGYEYVRGGEGMSDYQLKPEAIRTASKGR